MCFKSGSILWIRTAHFFPLKRDIFHPHLDVKVSMWDHNTPLIVASFLGVFHFLQQMCLWCFIMWSSHWLTLSTLSHSHWRLYQSKGWSCPSQPSPHVPGSPSQTWSWTQYYQSEPPWFWTLAFSPLRFFLTCQSGVWHRQPVKSDKHRFRKRKISKKMRVSFWWNIRCHKLNKEW